MKQLYCTCLLLAAFCLPGAVAQTSEIHRKPRLMLSLGGGLISHRAMVGSVDLTTERNHFFSVGGLLQARKGTQVPDDFKPGLFPIQPQQHTLMLTIRYGYVFDILGPHHRLMLSGGLGLGRFSTQVDFERKSEGIFGWGDNYSYTRIQKQSVGLIIAPTLFFLRRPLSGWSLGTVLLLNRVDPSANLMLTLHFGRIRSARPAGATSLE